MANGTMTLIQTTTVGAGGTLQIDFNSIPATYTDLLIKISSRDDRGADTTGATIKLNDSTTGFTTRRLYGNGATAISDSTSNNTIFDADNAANSTASVFSSWEIYIPNYAGNTNKSFSVDAVMENNTTTAFTWLLAGLWSNTSAITKVSLLLSGTIKFVQHTTASLYGITRVPTGAKATGGVIYDDTNYWYHVFTSSGTFTPSQSISSDVLVIAGGGAGGCAGDRGAGGGGAGGLLYHSAQSLTAQNYTVTIGAGGVGASNGSAVGNSGSNSQFGSLTASVGGGGGGSEYPGYQTGANGGSGGGGGGNGTSAGNGGTASTSGGTQGTAGGNGFAANNATAAGGGGGGAGVAGVNATSATPTAGGNGSSAYSSWGLATSTGQNSGGTVYYAGGGGAGGGGNSPTYAKAGGLGGGGAANAVNGGGNATNGTANTGGGGGAHSYLGTSGSGGSGIVIVRYAK